ncbi:MAG TPA: 16S rRNA (guanine(527)-N(7))-methyltransferase RsmG [Erysipelothrix sp.]|jgi:16S rRNA (guanine527-N7)-methyltransferase|nr:16S rRNA (guanine(527)-N(7))-methyltransferase RsmG [Erysipelothrix sp.]
MTLEKLKELHQLNSHQISQYHDYANVLIEQNKVMNLTAITEFDDIIEKHFHDSLLINELISEAYSFCDVGSGAGFPGLVLAIKNPDKHFTLVEPTKKRCNFLNDIIDLLKLENVTIINERAEDTVKVHRERFDVVSARAVANMLMLSELCLPLVKVDGLFIAMKGQKGLEELEDASFALKILGGKVISTELSMLSDESLRYNIVIQKIDKTPRKYPRSFGQIKRKPLGNRKGG